jgi:threonyl-tRNA synthetase
MAGCFDFLNQVYGVFGFDFHLKLSTRPDNYIGELSVWNNAEKVMRRLCRLMFKMS